METTYHDQVVFSTPRFEALRKFLEDHGRACEQGLEDFERELHRLTQAWEADVVGARLGMYDIDVPEVEVGGRAFRRKMKSTKEYHCVAGTFTIERTLYVPRSGGGKAVCPLEQSAGIIEGAWTPMAARVMAHAVAISTPREASEFFQEFGGMNPSTSSLDRLPKQLSEKWEAKREQFEAELREREEVPQEAVAVAVAIDGVQVPMKDGERAEKRRQPDKKPSGPAGFREVGCGTISFYGIDGEALHTIRYARKPEEKKTTLKSQILAELRSTMASCPGLEVMGLSDGAPDHWEFINDLRRELGIEALEVKKAVDLFHVLERVKRALDAYHGESTPESKANFEECRLWLREYADGPQRVLRALRYRRGRCCGAKRKSIDREVRYIEKRIDLMNYKQLREEGLPIGSGMVEAACKTLATERLKRSGMSWREPGVQAILTLRSLLQSKRWENAWHLLAEEYRTPIVMKLAA